MSHNSSKFSEKPQVKKSFSNRLKLRAFLDFTRKSILPDYELPSKKMGEKIADSGTDCRAGTDQENGDGEGKEVAGQNREEDRSGNRERLQRDVHRDHC